MIYVFLFIFIVTPLYAQALTEDLPDLIGPSPETVIKATTLGRAIDKLATDFNGTWSHGQHISGGCYGDALEYMELVETWANLTDEQEPGTLNVELVRVKAKLVEVVEALGDCLELVTEDLKEVRKATRNLPPK